MSMKSAVLHFGLTFLFKKWRLYYINMNILCIMTIAKSGIMRYNHSMLPNGTKIFSFKRRKTS